MINIFVPEKKVKYSPFGLCWKFRIWSHPWLSISKN